MLKSIDILVGLAVVMLTVSLVVTVLTQAITNLMQTRGRNLVNGIAGLLRQIHRDLPLEASQQIAKAVLTHPLVKSAGSRYGTVIHREELIALLLQFAADDGPHQLDDSLRGQLCDVLRANGIEDPAKALANVRSLVLLLEQAHPELSNNERYAMAYLQEAHSTFLSKINGWFDPTIDRVVDRFTNSARLITFAGSLAVAIVLQLDTAALVNRLSQDPSFRAALVQEAIKVNSQAAATNPAARPANSTLLPALSEQDKQNLQALADYNVIDIPTSVSDWMARWNGDNSPLKLVGILLTAMLLSLGAPFWYNALKNLIRLRSLIAQKDDDQRLSRQTNTSAPTAAVGVAAAASAGTPLLITGERGDLARVG